eukprot:11221887-Lingulodinium_polyedra.AAC.1
MRTPNIAKLRSPALWVSLDTRNVEVCLSLAKRAENFTVKWVKVRTSSTARPVSRNAVRQSSCPR